MMRTCEDGYKGLMTAVLAQTMTDYIQAVKVGGLDFSKKLKKERIKTKDKKRKDCDPKILREIETLTNGEDARLYIFDDSEESGNYVFGFKFICRYIGLDPERFRKKIKERREAFWRNVYAK